MKTIKVVTLLAAISFLISVPFSAEARDCSDPQGFHQKFMCKVTGGKSKAVVSSEEKKQAKKEKKKKDKSAKEIFDEKNKTLVDILSPGD